MKVAVTDDSIAFEFYLPRASSSNRWGRGGGFQ